MSILKRKQKKEEVSDKAKETKTPKEAKPSKKQTDASKHYLEGVIKKPWITEKATDKTADSVYVFEVDKDANKILVKEAFKNIYGIDPVKVRTISKSSRKRRRFGRKSSEKGFKKAYIYLEKGQEINIV